MLPLLIGIMSSAGGSGRRRAIRDSWMRWEGAGRDYVACFALGAAGVSASHQRTIAASEPEDLLWLREVADAGVLSIHKVWAWWRLAATWRGVTHVAKTDDDAFLHLPNVLADLSLLACVPTLVYGGIAYAGYNPQVYRMCGWSWQSKRSYEQRGCAAHGHYPAAPFPLGALQILSQDLVRELAGSREIEEFARATAASRCANPRLCARRVTPGWPAPLAACLDSLPEALCGTRRRRVFRCYFGLTVAAHAASCSVTRPTRPHSSRGTAHGPPM